MKLEYCYYVAERTNDGLIKICHEEVGPYYDRAEAAEKIVIQQSKIIAELSEDFVAVVNEKAVAEAKVRMYEDRDGLDGAVVDAIRTLLKEQNVPFATFIDDHVANAICQRNEAIKVIRNEVQRSRRHLSAETRDFLERYKDI